MKDLDERLELLQHNLERFLTMKQPAVCDYLEGTYIRDLELYRSRYGCTPKFYELKEWLLDYRERRLL